MYSADNTRFQEELTVEGNKTFCYIVVVTYTLVSRLMELLLFSSIQRLTNQFEMSFKYILNTLPQIEKVL